MFFEFSFVNFEFLKNLEKKCRGNDSVRGVRALGGRVGWSLVWLFIGLVSGGDCLVYCGNYEVLEGDGFFWEIRFGIKRRGI